MTEIKEIHFDSWDKLSNAINEYFTHFNTYIFRGHSNVDWKLESTFTRSINTIYKTKHNKEKLLKQHFKTFKQNLRGRIRLDLSQVTDNEIWAVGQHFGLYTPLLDWSESPYVALFFALQGKSETNKRCLWAISSSFISEINKSKEQIEIVRPLTNENPRLVSQQGLFLKLPFDSSLEEIAKTAQLKPEGIPFMKLTFDDSITNDALSILNNMNINKLTLFPDIIGSALHSNYLLEIDPYLTKIREKIWDDHFKRKKTES